MLSGDKQGGCDKLFLLPLLDLHLMSGQAKSRQPALPRTEKTGGEAKN